MLWQQSLQCCSSQFCLFHPQHTVAEYPSVQSIKQFLDRLSAKKLIFLVYVVVGIVETFLRPLELLYRFQLQPKYLGKKIESRLRKYSTIHSQISLKLLLLETIGFTALRFYEMLFNDDGIKIHKYITKSITQLL